MLNINYTLVGQKIKDKRKSCGLTQEKLAEKCDVSVSYIAHIERGTKSLSLETAVKISKILNISLDYLIIDELDNPDRVLSALENEINELTPNQKQVFLKMAKLILKNIDEL